MARTPRPAGSEQDAPEDYQPSDQDLGVGEETAADAASEQQAKIAAAMSDPVIATAIEQLVQQRIAAMAGGAQGVPDFLPAMRELGKQIADTLTRSTNATLEQMPGHVKPLPPEEIEKRASAWIEMQSLLADTTRRYWLAIEKGDHIEAEKNLSPLYLLNDDFFGPGEVGNEMYVRGETIRWFGVPGIYMEPRNGIAKQVSEYMWDYLGNEGAPSAEELATRASQMMRPSAPGSALPEMPLLLSARGRGRPNASRVSEMGIAERGPDNIVGTVVKVTRGGFGHAPVQPMTGPHQIRGPALADAPVGPLV